MDDFDWREVLDEERFLVLANDTTKSLTDIADETGFSETRVKAIVVELRKAGHKVRKLSGRPRIPPGHYDELVAKLNACETFDEVVELLGKKRHQASAFVSYLRRIGYEVKDWRPVAKARVTVKLTPLELEAAAVAAQAEGMTTDEWIKRRVDEGLLKPPPRDRNLFKWTKG
jgi:DNA-binding Lrp family transcriptional regulator